jgi:hypothetical protein
MSAVTFIAAYQDRYGVDHVAGERVEYEDGLAAKLVRLGVATAAPAPKAKPAPPVETAEAAPPENTAKRVRKANPRRAAK